MIFLDDKPDARRLIAIEKNAGLTVEHERYCPAILTWKWSSSERSS